MNMAQSLGRSTRNDGVKLLQQRNRQIPGGRHRVRQGLKIKKFCATGRSNRGGGGARNNFGASLNPGEGGFKIKKGLKGNGIAEKCFEGWGAEENVQKVEG